MKSIKSRPITVQAVSSDVIEVRRELISGGGPCRYLSVGSQDHFFPGARKQVVGLSAHTTYAAGRGAIELIVRQCSNTPLSAAENG